MSKKQKNMQVEEQVKVDKVETSETNPDALVKAENKTKENKANDKKQKYNKKKEKKQNAIVRFFKFIAKKIKELFSELKKVSWPSFGKVVKQTGVVIAVVIIFAVIVFGIDRLLAFLFGLLF